MSVNLAVSENVFTFMENYYKQESLCLLKANLYNYFVLQTILLHLIPIFKRSGFGAVMEKYTLTYDKKR